MSKVSSGCDIGEVELFFRALVKRDRWEVRVCISHCGADDKVSSGKNLAKATRG